MKYKSKIGVFFCDIYNTYFYNHENHANELKNFISNLKKIKLFYNLDYIFFSFITSATVEYLNDAIDDIKYHLPQDIILSKQYFANGYIEHDNVCNSSYKDKSKVINEEIKKYKQNYNTVICFFADDCVSNHLQLKKYNQDVISLILSVSSKDDDKNYYSINKGLLGINECIKKMKIM